MVFKLFAILQKYDFSSKSQLRITPRVCFPVVCDTAKVRFFKQITTDAAWKWYTTVLFAILQKYDFSSKSQLITPKSNIIVSCLRYCKSTIFQANHNKRKHQHIRYQLFAILQKYDFSSKSQPIGCDFGISISCLRYCKSTIFQANHNLTTADKTDILVVCDTAKVRFFKQITTLSAKAVSRYALFAILQKYDFSSKSQLNCHCSLFR